jgi:hypothetical protein
VIQYARIAIIHMVNDTTVTTELEGFFGSVQLFDGGRALIRLTDEDGTRTEVWHGIGAQTIRIRFVKERASG